MVNRYRCSRRPRRPSCRPSPASRCVPCRVRVSRACVACVCRVRSCVLGVGLVWVPLPYPTPYAISTRFLKTCTLRSFPANGKNKKKMSHIRPGEINRFSLPPLGSPVPPLRVGTLQLRKSTRVRCIVAWPIQFASLSQHQYAQTLRRTCGNGSYYSTFTPIGYIWVPG